MKKFVKLLLVVGISAIIVPAIQFEAVLSQSTPLIKIEGTTPNSYHQTITECTTILQNNPKDVFAYFNRAAARVGLREYQRAIEDLKIAADLSYKLGDIELQQRAIIEMHRIERL